MGEAKIKKQKQDDFNASADALFQGIYAERKERSERNRAEVTAAVHALAGSVNGMAVADIMIALTYVLAELIHRTASNTPDEEGIEFNAGDLARAALTRWASASTTDFVYVMKNGSDAEAEAKTATKQ